MTDAYTTIDGALWAAALVLAGVAIWLSRPRALDWEPDSFFAAVWSVLRRPDPLPLREGPIPAGGWDGDVAALGEEHDPAVRLGPACTWAALPTWSEAIAATVRRRLDHVHVLWLEAPAITLPEVRVRAVPEAGRVDEALTELCAAPEVRLVFFASRNPGGVLRRLHDEPGLRDRVRAVVLVGADLSGDREWIAEHFTHAGFDLEMARELPFFTLRVEGGGAQVLREPPKANRTGVRIHDLGVIPADAVGDVALARALVMTLAALE